MSIKTSKDAWVNTGICPICDRNRERDKALAKQKAELLAACEDLVFHVINDGVPWEVLKEKVTAAQAAIAKSY